MLEKYCFRNMIDTLNFLACRTRPDIATSAGIRNRFSTGPSRFHIDPAKRILGNLKGTCDYTLVVPFSKNTAQYQMSQTLILQPIRLTGIQDQVGMGFGIMAFLCGLLESNYVLLFLQLELSRYLY